MPWGLKRYYGSGSLHFITWSCYRRRPLLGNPARRDLLLAVLELMRVRYRFAVIGYARSEMDNDAFREYARTAVEKFSRTPVDDHLWRAFAESLHYQSGNFDEEGFKKDEDFIRAMIRFRIDEVVFGIAEAQRHLLSAGPQSQLALSMFGEAVKLTELARANGRSKAH